MGFTPGPFELLMLLAIGAIMLTPVVGIAYLIWVMANSGRRRDEE